MELEQMLADLRAYREAYAARFNYDVYAMGEDMRRRQGEDGRPVVSFPPRRPEGWQPPEAATAEPPAPPADAPAEPAPGSPA